MKTFCGLDCCDKCLKRNECGGCEQAQGRPFGGACVAASCVRHGGAGKLAREKERLMGEINALCFPGLSVDDLNLLNGFYVNLEYPLPNGTSVRLLDDRNIYWGNQIEIPGSERCWGVIADESFLLVCTYGCGGSDPQLVLYRKREIEA